MIIPSIDRITPQLTICRKSIRRTSGNRDQILFFIQFKELRMRPGIRTVVGNINRNVSDNLNTLFVRILDAELKKSARMMLRLSSMTLPHAFARVMLVEQIYRVWSILNNHPYHRA